MLEPLDIDGLYIQAFLQQTESLVTDQLSTNIEENVRDILKAARLAVQGQLRGEDLDRAMDGIERIAMQASVILEQQKATGQKP